MNTKKRLKVKEIILREFFVFEKQAGKLPSPKNLMKYKDVGAVWVVSGGGSYFAPSTDSPSDRAYAKNKWYPGQDKARLDYAKSWLDALARFLPSSKPILIYNGTKKQNEDLLKAIDTRKFKFPKSRLYLAPGEIARTLDQVKRFSLPPTFPKEGIKLAVLSHSAHLPRILRFMKKFPKPFKNIEIIPLSINVSDKAGQRQMKSLELNNLLGYIARGEAASKPYPYGQSQKEKSKSRREVVKVSHIVKDDLMDIYKLSNQDSIRAMSFYQDKIKLKDHKKWFAKKIKDKNVVMLKATIDDKLAGQVRLEAEGSEAVIGVSTSEKFRGRGIASCLLQEAARQAKQKGLTVINAYIKPENQPSINLFEKNGYVFAGKKKQAGAQANKYIYKI